MEGKQRVSSASQFFLWFGASISLAEIMTGALIAPLGFEEGMKAIIIGHLIGATILFLAAWMSATTRYGALQATRISFGSVGSYGFTALNLTQLLGWGSVMIATGTTALNGISKQLFGFDNQWAWAIGVVAILLIWVALGLEKISKLNVIAVSLLFLFTLVLARVIFSSGAPMFNESLEPIAFSTAVELSAVMALSFLPLIGDYTSQLKNPKTGTVVSVLGYSLGSTFMFTIGLGGSLFVGSSDISAIMLASGLGLMALVIVFFSTIITTFIDSYSSGINMQNFFPKVNAKVVSFIFTIIALFVAMLATIDAYESFLYFIGSIFSPLYGILFAEFYVLRRRTIEGRRFVWPTMLLWVAGLVLYQLTLDMDVPLGHAIWVLIICFIARIVMEPFMRGNKK